MAEDVDYKEKYSEIQKEMWEWRQKYFDSKIQENRSGTTAILIGVATGVVGAAVGYVAGVLRAGR